MMAKRIIMLLLGLPFLAAATTWYASPNGADNAACTADAPGSLKRAVSLAVSASTKENGDVVQLAPGTYWHTNAVIAINAKYLTIQGATDDPADTVIRGIGSEKYMRAFNVNNYATFKGVTITNFAAPYSYMANCVIYSKTATAAGAVRMENCVIAGCSGEAGSFSARPVCNGGEFRNCLFVANVGANRAPIMGGSFFVATDCVFRNNRNGTLIASCNGANLTSAAFTNCVFLSNSCRPLNCGGTLYRCAFTNNSTTTQDGTISSAYALRVIDCDFHNNQATRGGATYGDKILAFNCTFTSNHCYDTVISHAYGGACAYNGVYSNCVFRHNYINASNRSWYGGAIRGGYAMDCVFDGNSAHYGGATYGTIATGCVFSNNVATLQGAATYRGASTNCLISAQAYKGSDASGGITFEGRLTRCVLAGNTSTRNAFYNPIAVGCLISGNKAASGYSIAPNGLFVNCTLADNTTVNKAAVTGGTYTNTIVAATTGTADIGGGTHVHTLYGTKTGSPGLDAGSIQTDDPRFSGASAEHPYSTRGRSPARDAGVAAFWTAADTDIAGKCRLNGPVDIGCYEFWPLRAPTSVLLR